MSNAKALESAFVILLFSPPYWLANISLQPTAPSAASPPSVAAAELGAVRH